MMAPVTSRPPTIGEGQPSGGLLIIGCGYSGQVIARQAHRAGMKVWGTSRVDEHLDAIAAAGAVPVRFEAGGELPADVLQSIDAVVDCVGPPWTQEPDPTALILEALASAALRSFVYLSSTSVYGNFDGGWVDEETPCAPTSDAGRRRLAAETLLLEAYATTGLPACICRLPGIYGPGRSVLDRLRSGNFRVIAGHSVHSNRIHVEDLARGVLAAIERGRPGRIYLLTDDEPAPLDAVGEFAAALLGLPVPPPLAAQEVAKSAHPNALAMLTDSKRLSNRRMREELGVIPAFPSYREGLRAILDSRAHIDG